MQAVWFSPTASQSEASSLFEKAFQRPAEQTQRNALATPQNRFLSSASSNYEGIARAVQIQPGRVDLSILPEITDSWNGDLPTLDAQEATKTLSAAVSIISNAIGSSTQRFAIVTSAIKNSDSANEAFIFANEKLNGIIPFPDGTDLMAQVNRRTTSKVLTDKDVVINRLVRIGTGSVQSVQISPPPQMGVVVQPLVVSESHFAEYTIDINTVPRVEMFSVGDVEKLSTEMMEISEYLLNNPWTRGLS